MKKYKNHYVWTDREDVSVEPRQNMVKVPAPILADPRRKFFSFSHISMKKINETLKISQA
jgi:hypothetical protein